MTHSLADRQAPQDRAGEPRRAADSYAAVQSAWHALAAKPENPALRETVAGALQSLGLAALAAHVRQGCTGPTGAIPWGTRREQWAANLKALASREPDVAAALRARWNACRDELELHRCADGNWQVRLRTADSPWGHWLPAFADHRAQARDLRVPGGLAAARSGLAFGIAHGWLLQRLYDETTDTFLHFCSCLYLLAPNAAELAAAMHLHDWRTLLGDRRVQLFVGDDCVQQCDAFLERMPHYPMPEFRINLPTWNDRPRAELAPMLQRAVAARDNRARALRAQLDALYAGRDLSCWADRYARRDSEPLRILGIASRHSTFILGSMKECLDGLRGLGHEVRLLSESEPFFLGHGAIELFSVQLDFQPDLVFMIDNHRGQMPGLIVPHVPALMWIQDALGRLLCPDAGRQMGPLDFVIGYGRDTCVADCHYPPDGFLACDVPGVVADRLEIRPEWREKHACDVSFVSTASRTPEQLRDERRAQCPPEETPLLDAIYDEITARLARGDNVPDPRALLDRLCRDTRVEITDPARRQDLETWYLHRMFDWGFRQQALRWVADWARRHGRRFHLYGRGWENCPGLAEFAVGHVWQRDELAAVIRLSRVNLQLFATTALHQRTYDILGAGGFALFRRAPADYRDDDLQQVEVFLRDHAPRDLLLPEHEPIARLVRRHCESVELIVNLLERPNGRLDHTPGRCAAARFPLLAPLSFDTPARLESLLDLYLADDEARAAAADTLRRALLPDATYTARMRDAIDFIARRLSLRARYGCRGARPLRGPEPARLRTALAVRGTQRVWYPAYDDVRDAIASRLLDAVAARFDRAVVIEETDALHRDPQQSLYELLDTHQPDLVISTARPRFTAEHAPALRQLLLAPHLTGACRDLPTDRTLALAVCPNALGAEFAPLDPFARWSGLPPAQMSPFILPIDLASGDNRAAADIPHSAFRIPQSSAAACDVSVDFPAIAPDRQWFDAWMTLFNNAERGGVSHLLDACLRLRTAILDDPFAATPAGIQRWYERLMTFAPAGGVAERMAMPLRALVLPRLIDTWHQQRWLEHLIAHCTQRDLSLRIRAFDSWLADPLLAPHLVPWTLDSPAPRGRVHVCFSCGLVPPAMDLARLAEGTPTLVLDAPARHAPAGNEPCPAAGSVAEVAALLAGDAASPLRFSDPPTLDDRLDAALAGTRESTAATHELGAAVRDAASQQRVINDLLAWMATNPWDAGPI